MKEFQKQKNLKKVRKKKKARRKNAKKRKKDVKKFWSLKKDVQKRKTTKRKTGRQKRTLQSLATVDFKKDKRAQRLIKFEYKEYFRDCTRFYSSLDHDWPAVDSLRRKDTKLKRRKFKLYSGLGKS